MRRETVTSTRLVATSRKPVAGSASRRTLATTGSVGFEGTTRPTVARASASASWAHWSFTPLAPSVRVRRFACKRHHKVRIGLFANVGSTRTEHNRNDLCLHRRIPPLAATCFTPESKGVGGGRGGQFT